MLRVNGLFGHVRRNDLRSLVAFLGFAVAIQILAATVLMMPLMVLDVSHLPILDPLGYLWRYGPWVLVATCFLFAWKYHWYLDSVEEALGLGFSFARQDARLARLTAQLAITAGIPQPRTAVLESAALNAFACGTKAEDSYVVVTRGLLEALDERELRAVLAHEITHIKNGDVRFLASAQVLFNIMLGLQKLQKFQLGSRKLGCAAFASPLIVLPFIIGTFGSGLAFLIARATRSGISLSREFIADAEAVRLTHDAAALVSALRKVQGRSRIENLSPALEAMMIDGVSSGAGATHPTIIDRIQALIELTGPMAAEAYVSGPIEAVRAGFGRRGLAAAAVAQLPREAEPERTAAEEYVLNFAKSRREPTKLEPWHYGLILGGFAFPVVFGTLLAPPDASQQAEITSASPSTSEAKLVRKTGCFPEYVQIGGDGDLKVSYRQGLIDAYRRGDRTDEAYRPEFERYVAWHEKSRDAVASPVPGATIEPMLVEYVRMRKMNLEQSWDLFGPEGFAAMKRDYQSAGDRAAVDQLRARLKARTSWPLQDEVTMADLNSLARNPDGFVPCRTLRA